MGLPPGAGERSESAHTQSEHSPGGLLNNGPLVIVHTCNGHRVSTHRCTVLEFVSVPAPHLLVKMADTGKERIIFCNSIEYIDPA